MCLEGAVLFKRDNVAKPTKDRGEPRPSKAMVKAAMRYRGDP